MSAENVEVVRRAADAFNRGDVDALMADAVDDFLFLPGRSALHGGYRGEAGLRKFFADNEETYEVFTMRIDEIREVGDQVVQIGIVHLRARGGGLDTEGPLAAVVTLRAGKMVKVEDFRERSAALAAVGLSDVRG